MHITQVLGNAKGGVAAIVSVLVFRNPVSWAACMGYAVATGGVYLYSRAKGSATRGAKVGLSTGKAADDNDSDTAFLLDTGKFSQRNLNADQRAFVRAVPASPVLPANE